MAEASRAAFSSVSAAPVAFWSALIGEATEPNGAHRVGSRAPTPGDYKMTSKPDPKKTAKNADKGTKKHPATQHPGMMGDGTEEQNLGQRGNPAARIKEDEVDAAFAKGAKK
jgi:hypothetical protein